MLTRSQLNECAEDKENCCRILEKYRVRLAKTAELPIVGDSEWYCKQNAEALVVDGIPVKKDEEDVDMKPLKSSGDDGEFDLKTEHEDNGEGPLEFTFLTLDKLNKQIRWEELSALTASSIAARCGASASYFDAVPIPHLDAVALRQRLSKELVSIVDPSLATLPVFVISRAVGCLGASLYGLHHSKKTVATSLTRCFGVASSTNLTALAMQHRRLAGMNSRSRASALYEIIGPMPKKASPSVVSGKLSIVFRWNVTHTDALTTPPPSSEGILRFSPGWKDNRIVLHSNSLALESLMCMCDALAKSDVSLVVWNKNDTSATDENIINATKMVIEHCRGVPGKAEVDGESRHLDLTEQLWCVLSRCTSYSQLVRALRVVFDSLSSGPASAVVHSDNKSLLARLVRDAGTGELHLPRLEALTPIQILAEIAYEKIIRDISHTFVHLKFLADVSQATTYVTLGSRATGGGLSVEQRARGLIPVHLALQTMIETSRHLRLDEYRLNAMCKTVLGQFTQHPLEQLPNIVFETEIRKIDVKAEVLTYVRPVVWMNETWWNIGQRSVFTLAHFTRQPKLEQLTELAFDKDSVEAAVNEEKENDEPSASRASSGPVAKKSKAETDPNTAYLCTLTTVSTFDRNQLTRYG